MSAIINENINRRYLFFYFFKEVSIGLGAYENLNIFLFKLFAIWININAVYFGFVAKIMLPHLQTAPVIGANFQHNYFLIPVFAEMTVVNFKIMLPLIDYPAFIIIEICL